MKTHSGISTPNCKAKSLGIKNRETLKREYWKSDPILRMTFLANLSITETNFVANITFVKYGKLFDSSNLRQFSFVLIIRFIWLRTTSI